MTSHWHSESVVGGVSEEAVVGWDADADGWRRTPQDMMRGLITHSIRAGQGSMM